MPPVRVLPSGRVESYGHTLRNLIAVAYDVNLLYQKIEGKQELLETEFVVEAKAAAPSLTPAEAKALVRTLLEERVQRRWWLQPRDVDGYLLMPGVRTAGPLQLGRHQRQAARHWRVDLNHRGAADDVHGSAGF